MICNKSNFCLALIRQHETDAVLWEQMQNFFVQIFSPTLGLQRGTRKTYNLLTSDMQDFLAKIEQTVKTVQDNGIHFT